MSRISGYIWTSLNSKWLLVFSILLLTAIFTTKADRNFGWTKAHKEDKVPILNDGAGYYAWMPKWYLYSGDTSNFGFAFKMQEKYPRSAFGSGINMQNGRLYNKYYTGTAIVLSPFFGLGHIIAGIAGVDQDGYSWPYQLTVVLGGIFYFSLGLIFITLLLGKLGVRNFYISACLALIAFGTNIGFYVYEYTSYSHVFSFAFCALFLLLAVRWKENDRNSTLVLLAGTLGIIFLLRPTNVLIVLMLPFVFASTREFLTRIQELFGTRKLAFLVSLLTLALVVSVQFCNNYFQTGSLSLNTYESEGFDHLSDPKVGEVLFGFRKGLFAYSPALLLFIPGLIQVFRKNRRLFFGIALTFCAFTYIISSWWCWWYGGGLGMRPMFDLLVIFIIPVAFLFEYSARWAKILIVLFIIVTCKIALTFEAQARGTILHFEDMNREKYSRIFMHTEPRYDWAAHLDFDTLPKQISQAGKTEYFDIYRKTSVANRKYLIKSLVADSTLTFSSGMLKKQNGYFGGKIISDIFLFTDRPNVAFYVSYYSGGKEIRHDQFFIGSFFPEVETFTKISLDLNPGLKYADLDSLGIFLDRNADSILVRNTTFTSFSYQKSPK